MSGLQPAGPSADQTGLVAMPREETFPGRPLPNQMSRNRRYRCRQTAPMPGTTTWLRVNCARRPWRKPTPELREHLWEEYRRYKSGL